MIVYSKFLELKERGRNERYREFYSRDYRREVGTNRGVIWLELVNASDETGSPLVRAAEEAVADATDKVQAKMDDFMDYRRRNR